MMIDQNNQVFRFGGGGDTSLTVLGLVLIIAAAILIILLPRKYALIPLLIVIFAVPESQEVVIGGLHFVMLRIMLLIGWIRLFGQKVLSKDKLPMGKMVPVDTALILWVFSVVVSFTLLWGQWSAFVNRMGFLYTTLGAYFLLRYFIRDQQDIERTIKVFAIICLFISVSMMTEQITERNLFSAFGGVPEIVSLREGHVRSQASFAHAILAGTFGAILMPLYIGLWISQTKSGALAALGFASATVIAIASMSSTPIVAYGAGSLALCMWPIRRHMRTVRWAIVAILVGLHMAMKAPVWALIARIDLVGGSSGYHRFLLVDQFIRRFGEWWLFGAKNNAQWGYEMSDASNAYVASGIDGGLFGCILFILVIVSAFKMVGRARAEFEGDTRAALFLWTLGASLFGCAVSFFGIVYFDQTVVAWYALLAMIATAATIPKKSSVIETHDSLVYPGSRLILQRHE